MADLDKLHRGRVTPALLTGARPRPDVVRVLMAMQRGNGMRSLREILVPADLAIEGATGLALILVPDFVTRILLGSELPEIGAVVTRVAGIALVAMVIGAWLGRHADRSSCRSRRQTHPYWSLRRQERLSTPWPTRGDGPKADAASL